MLFDVIAHKGYANAVKEPAMKAVGENTWLHRELKPSSVLRLALEPDAVPAELFLFI